MSQLLIRDERPSGVRNVLVQVFRSATGPLSSGRRRHT